MILRVNLDFFVKTLCAVPCSLLPPHAARLPRFRGTALASKDTIIDAGARQSVSRVTHLCYTPYSLPVKAFFGPESEKHTYPLVRSFATVRKWLRSDHQPTTPRRNLWSWAKRWLVRCTPGGRESGLYKGFQFDLAIDGLDDILDVAAILLGL